MSIGFHYVPGLIAIVSETLDSGDLRGVVDSIGGQLAEDPGQLAQALSRGGGQADQDAPDDRESEFARRLMQRATFASVDHPVAASAELTAYPGLSASPIHILGYQWHKAMSDLRHEPLEGTPLDPVKEEGKRIIAAVDTGLVEGAAPWLTHNGNVRPVDAGIDMVPAGGALPSHGTFVASVLRRHAPGHAVVMARAAEYAGPMARRPEIGNHDDTDPAATTEAHVADAILRLIESLGENRNVDALNLSFGGLDTEIPGVTMALLTATLDDWRQRFPKAPIFAAAGNSSGSRPVFPAAFREVRGVGACDSEGNEVVWLDENGDDLLTGQKPSPAPGRHWVDDVALGTDIAGLSGDGEAAISWSGSSFATAIASARYASGESPTNVENGVSWWT